MQPQMKLGFWAVLSFVISSQIGSGIFQFPTIMAGLGVWGLISWCLTGLGAFLLVLVFSRLCTIYPETGGPHVFVTPTFGQQTGFFVAWSYWVLAWMGMTPTLNTVAGSLALALQWNASPLALLGLQTIILGGLVILNLRGVQASGRWEVWMTILKLIPLGLLPILGLFFLTPENFAPTTTLSPLQSVSSGTFLALWGFIGLESATAPAGSVHNPRKTIPRALTIGTVIVLLLYLANTAAVVGLVSPSQLAQSVCPHGLALERVFGVGQGKWIALLIVVVCIGALNAWILICSQVAKGAATSGFFPPFFCKENSRKAPIAGIYISAFLCWALICTLQNNSLAAQMRFVIDVSVVAYIIIYLLCIGVFLKKLWEGHLKESRASSWCIGCGALLFCFWALWGSGFSALLWTLIIPLAGLPFQWFWKRKESHAYRSDRR